MRYENDTNPTTRNNIEQLYSSASEVMDKIKIKHNERHKRCKQRNGYFTTTGPYNGLSNSVISDDFEWSGNVRVSTQLNEQSESQLTLNRKLVSKIRKCNKLRIITTQQVTCY